MKKVDGMDHHPKLKKFVRELAPEEYLFRQGQMGNTMFILLDGMVELVAEKEDSSHVTGILEKGDFLGERAITMKEPYRRYFSAKAIQPTKVLEIAAPDLEFLRITAPDVMTDIMVQAFNVAASRLARMNVLVQSLRSSNNEERLIRCILYFCRTTGRPVPGGGVEVALSPVGIHYYIDMPSDQIQARLKDFEAQGLLKPVNNEFFFIPDVAALTAQIPETEARESF